MTTVLVADDDPDLRESVRDILEAEGYGVLTATDLGMRSEQQQQQQQHRRQQDGAGQSPRRQRHEIECVD